MTGDEKMKLCFEKILDGTVKKSEVIEYIFYRCFQIDTTPLYSLTLKQLRCMAIGNYFGTFGIKQFEKRFKLKRL